MEKKAVSTGETRELVKFSRQLYVQGLDEKLSTKFKSLLVDQIGLQVGCSDLPWSRTIHKYHSERFPIKGRRQIHRDIPI